MFWEKRFWFFAGLFVLLACLMFLTSSGMAHMVYAAEGVAGQSVDVGNNTVAVAGDSSTGHKASASHGEEEGITHSQVMNFIWDCLNFTILAIVLVKYLRKPISDALRGRTDSIRTAFDELEIKRLDAERKYAEYEKKVSGMDAEAESILKSFVEQGETEKAKIIAQAQDAAERIKAQAELYVHQELSKARGQLQVEIAEMAVKMAEDMIRKNISEQDHHRLISEYLERVVTKN